MATYQGVFERYETKYLLSSRQYQAIRQGMEAFLQEDQYGLHTICSLYLDTGNFELIRASLDKPVYKEKLRLRSYGVPQGDGTVFLELKKKFRGVVYKRRVPMTLGEARAYLRSPALARPATDGQILREIDWMMGRLAPTPKALIAYDRIALAPAQEDGPRVTFDRNIRWRGHTLDLAKGDWGSLLLPKDQVLMEVKTGGALPLWLCSLLDRLELAPASFSKYGTCYQNYLRQAGALGGIHCA